MSIALVINGTEVYNGSTYTMAEQSVSSTTTEPVIIANIGTNPVTINSITPQSFWGRNIIINGTVPAVLEFGENLNLTIGPRGGGPLNTIVFAGSFFSRFVISYTELGVTSSFTFDVLLVVSDSSLSSSPLVLTFEQMFQTVVNAWVISGPSTPSNPAGVYWNINTVGHYDGLYINHILPALQSGQRHILLHTPFGGTHLYYHEQDYQFDNYLENLAIAAEFNRPIWHSDFQRCVQAILDYDDNVVVYIYTGSLTHDEDFLDLQNNHDAAGFIDRVFRSIAPFIHHERLHFCLDSPYSVTVNSSNPQIQPGEARFETCKMLLNLFEANGRKLYCEPRPPPDETYWHGTNGWNYIMIDQAYWRSNPAWFAGTDAASDAQMAPGEILRWYVNQTDQMLPYMIADTINQGHRPIVTLRDYLVRGNTTQQLYEDVQRLLYRIRGIDPNTIEFGGAT